MPADRVRVDTAVPVEPPPPPPPLVGVRTPKSRQNISSRIHVDGEFMCFLYSRKSPHKVGLSRHVEASHPEALLGSMDFNVSYVHVCLHGKLS